MKRRWVAPLVFLVLFVCLWESIRIVFRLPEIVLPSLVAVGTAVFQEPRFFTHCLVTLAETFAGFLLGNGIAVIMAVLILRWKTLEVGLMPYAIAVKTTPIIAVAPILLLWFGAGMASKVVAAASVCFFPTLVNLVRGLRLVDKDEFREYADMFAVWDAGWWRTLWFLRVPFSLPLLFSALKISSSLALVGAVVGEFIAANAGIGYLIVVYSRRLETASMFAAVFASALLGVLLFYLILMVERLFAKRFTMLSNSEELL